MQERQPGFRETITTSAEARGRYVRQSSEPAAYGDVWLRVEPLKCGSGFEFVNALAEDVIPPEYIESVEGGVREVMADGMLQGYPMTDLRVTLFGGSYHEVDSSARAFKMAGSMGFKEAVRLARPIVLKPDAGRNS
jgi:elongation factor G